jgi:putative endopeptidase
VKQFDNYYANGIKVNGTNTLKENIADLGGVSVAFAAFKQWLIDNPSYKTSTSALPFTPNQRFFLAYAQNRVESYRKEVTLDRIKHDVHAIGILRVDGILKNMPEFYEAFNIKAGDDMYLNKADRVSIWNLNEESQVSSSTKSTCVLLVTMMLVAYHLNM